MFTGIECKIHVSPMVPYKSTTNFRMLVQRSLASERIDMKVIIAIVALCVLLEAQAAPTAPLAHSICTQEKIGIFYPDCSDYSLYFMCTGVNEHVHASCHPDHFFSFDEQGCVVQALWHKAAICQALPEMQFAPEFRPELEWPHHQQQPGQPWPQPHPEQGWPQPQPQPLPEQGWPQPHPEQPLPEQGWPQPHPDQPWPQPHPEQEWHQPEPYPEHIAQQLPEFPCNEQPVQDCPCPVVTQCPVCDDHAQHLPELPCNPPQPDWTQPPIAHPVPPVENWPEHPIVPLPPVEIWPEPPCNPSPPQGWPEAQPLPPVEIWPQPPCNPSPPQTWPEVQPLPPHEIWPQPPHVQPVPPVEIWPQPPPVTDTPQQDNPCFCP